MAKNYKTRLIIEGDGSGAIRVLNQTGSELDKFDRKQKHSRSAMDAMAKSWRHLENNAGRYAAGLALVTTSSIALAARQARSATEADNLARSLDVSTQSLMEWQYAGERVGINAGKMGDIFKDASDKLGDFIATGGGEAADMFENLNLNVAELRRLKPDEQLIRIGEAIGEVGDRSQQVFYLESIADDASRLLPLLENNAAQLKALKQEARDFGVALSAEDVARLREANSSMMRLRGAAEGLANDFSVALAPSITYAADEALDLRSVFRDPAFAEGVSTIANATISMASGLADSVREIGRFKTAIDELDLGGIGGFVASRTGPGWLAEQMGWWDGGGSDRTAPTKTAALEPIDVQASPLRSRAMPEAAAVKRTSKLADAYAAMNGRLSESIALFDQSGQAARVRYEIERGSLQGISNERERALMQMAREIDGMEQQKAAIAELFPEFERLQRIKQLQTSVGAMPAGMQGFGQRRAADMLRETALGGLPQAPSLDAAVGGPFSEVSRLEGERSDYQQQYEQRREAFQAYAEKHQDDAARAHQALEILEQDHQQRMLQYDQETQKAQRKGYAETFGGITDLIGAFAGEQSGLYKAMFATSKAFAIADSIVQIQGAIAKASNMPFPANLASMGVVASQTAGIINTISSTTMSGQAHDGIDNVPREGTWLLDRGERVIDRRTNVDLKQYLQRENQQMSAGSGGSLSIPVSITVEAKQGVSEDDARRQGEAMGRAFKDSVKRVMVSEMRSGGLLSNVKRPA